MAKIRMVNGSIHKSSEGLTTIEVTDGHFKSTASDKNHWHADEKGNSEHQYNAKKVEAEKYQDDINVKIRLFCKDPKHNNVEIKEDEITYISAVPEMPSIWAKVEINSAKGLALPLTPFGWYLPVVLEIEHKEKKGNKHRNDIQRYPVGSNLSIWLTQQFPFLSFINSSITAYSGEILPKYKNIFRGGKATLKVYSDDSLKTVIKKFSFQIRGINPTKQQVKDYLRTKGYLSRYWFINKMIIHESFSESLSVIQQFNQPGFNKKIILGTDYLTNLGGMPYYGDPDGWGACQLDYSSSADSKDPNEIKTAPTQTLWHWKENIDLLIKRLTDEKVVDMKTNIPIRIKEFKKINPGIDVTKNNTEKIEGEITYINCQSEIPILAALNMYMNSGNNSKRGEKVKSLLDADLMRRYNGGRFLVDLKRVNNNAVWTIDDVSSKSGNYVEKVSKITE